MTFAKPVYITFLWLLCLLVAVASLRFLVGGVAATMPHMLFHADARPVALFLHIGLAPVALALIPFQFWRDLRSQRPTFHRLMGRAYGIAILLSAPTGLILAINTDAGLGAATGFGLLAIVWFVTTARGVLAARARLIADHRIWMIRSAALTFAAVTLRLYIVVGEVLELPQDLAYQMIAWLCWVPNALIAEWIIRRGSTKVEATIRG